MRGIRIFKNDAVGAYCVSNSDATGTLIAFEALTAMLVHRDVGFYSRPVFAVDWHFLWKWLIPFDRVGKSSVDWSCMGSQTPGLFYDRDVHLHAFAGIEDVQIALIALLDRDEPMVYTSRVIGMSNLTEMAAGTDRVLCSEAVGHDAKFE